MPIKLKLLREEYDELDSFLDTAVNDVDPEDFQKHFRGIDTAVLAKVHEKMIRVTERVFRDELVGMNASEGRQRLSWQPKTPDLDDLNEED